MNEQKSRLKTVPGVAGESASFGGATFFIHRSINMTFESGISMHGH
jgi:hypothetical protein